MEGLTAIIKNNMVDKKVMDKYEMTIGIECHVQLKTKSKLFAPVDNDARDAAPNTTVSEICFGLPGTLPVLNKEAVHLAVRAGHTLNGVINKFSKFDRKHYFYPDLPMGYQISQFDEPTVGKGRVAFGLRDGREVVVGITRAHLEADAGKLTHPDGADYSLVDLNRAGTPLIEIVSEPEIHSAEEAKAFARELNLLMRYGDISDANLFYGNQRFDVNISVAKKGAKEFGTRAEIKNLNSFKAIEGCVEYEFKRQVELLEDGGEVVQETRGWDDGQQKTFSQRSKADAHDYRYMPEPDIPPIVLSDDYITEVGKELPVMPSEVRLSLKGLGLDYSQIETLVDRPSVAWLMEEVIVKTDDKQDAKRIANWLIGLNSSAEDDHSEVQINIEDLISLSKLVGGNKLSSSAAKEVLAKLLDGQSDPLKIANELNLMQVSDSGELQKMVDEVVASNPSAVEDVKNGEQKAVQFLVGQVMKLSRGKANPGAVQEIIREKLL